MAKINFLSVAILVILLSGCQNKLEGEIILEFENGIECTSDFYLYPDDEYYYIALPQEFINKIELRKIKKLSLVNSNNIELDIKLYHILYSSPDVNYSSPTKPSGRLAFWKYCNSRMIIIDVKNGAKEIEDNFSGHLKNCTKNKKASN